jgi:hypothetical protein
MVTDSEKIDLLIRKVDHLEEIIVPTIVRVEKLVKLIAEKLLSPSEVKQLKKIV